MKTLFIIPARGGSKGIPRKNIKKLNGKPLIEYSINQAKRLTDPQNILVSTDDLEIANIASNCGVKPPYLRPKELATDSASSYDVYLNAIKYYESLNIFYDIIVVLQPTSPFRKLENIKDSIKLYKNDIDMVVSVKETNSNPYYVLFEENKNGFLRQSKPSDIIRRQDCPKVYEYNGAVYVINVESLKEKPIYNFMRIKKYLMDEIDSLDLDTPIDWLFAEFLISNNLIK
tara:strand:- start:46 stop:735 length:690 start_codon:yes stop_codon:yes gene_type:complete